MRQARHKTETVGPAFGLVFFKEGCFFRDNKKLWKNKILGGLKQMNKKQIMSEKMQMEKMWQEIVGYFDADIKSITLDGMYVSFYGYYKEKHPDSPVPSRARFKQHLKNTGVQIIKKDGKCVCVGIALKKSGYINLFEGHCKLKEKEREAVR